MAAKDSDSRWDIDYPPTVLVDVSNVAHGSPDGAPPKLRNVEIVLAALMEARLVCHVWADGNLRYEIDRPAELNDLIELGKISEVQREPADRRLLEEANELLRSGMPVYLLSRDRFLDYRQAKGIPRIEFTFGARDTVQLRPSLDSLLSARRFADTYPDLMPLPEGMKCLHPRTKTDRRGSHTRRVCLRCEEVVSLR